MKQLENLMAELERAAIYESTASGVECERAEQDLVDCRSAIIALSAKRERAYALEIIGGDEPANAGDRTYLNSKVRNDLRREQRARLTTKEES